MAKKYFTITDDHLKLAREMYVTWNDCEFGAPEINPKRPYGNSDAYGDIADALGITQPDWDQDQDWDQDDLDRMMSIHKEMKTVIQITLNTGSMEPGTYERIGYSNDWKRCDKQEVKR